MVFFRRTSDPASASEDGCPDPDIPGGPTTSVPCQSRATGMNMPQSSRQLRSWLMQATGSIEWLKNNGDTLELEDPHLLDKSSLSGSSDGFCSLSWSSLTKQTRETK